MHVHVDANYNELKYFNFLQKTKLYDMYSSANCLDMVNSYAALCAY